MRVLIVGDSQAAGAPGRALEDDLRRRGYDTRRIGHSGHGAYDWTRLHWSEYRGALQLFRPNGVIMVFGSNDAASPSLERAMRMFIAESPVPVWYTGPPRYDRRPDVQAKGARIRDLAKRVFGRRYVDAWPVTGPEAGRSPDGLHFTSSGGRPWGELASRSLTTAPSVLEPWWKYVVAGSGVAVLVFYGWKWLRPRTGRVPRVRRP